MSYKVTVKQTVMATEVNDAELAAQIEKMLNNNESDARFLIETAAKRPDLLKKARTALKFL